MTFIFPQGWLEEAGISPEALDEWILRELCRQACELENNFWKGVGMNEVEKMAAKVALQQMIARGWIDICTIDKIGQTMNIPVASSPAYKTLSLLHCIDFKLMHEALRCEIPRLLQECLGMNPFEKEGAVEEQPKSTGGILGFLFNTGDKTQAKNG
jgi:hypothetical protein